MSSEEYFGEPRIWKLLPFAEEELTGDEWKWAADSFESAISPQDQVQYQAYATNFAFIKGEHQQFDAFSAGFFQSSSQLNGNDTTGWSAKDSYSDDF